MIGLCGEASTNESDIAAHVNVDAVFPAETPNVIAMCAAIAQLSRDDAPGSVSTYRYKCVPGLQC
jgi:dTDP-4-dehydrorhamnose reductase